MISARHLRWCIWASVFLALCAKEQNTDDSPVAVLGTDTLSRSQILGYICDSLPESHQLCRTILAISMIDGTIGDNGIEQDSLVQADGQALKEQLSLTMNKEWSLQGTNLLFAAARQLHKRADTLHNSDELRQYLDSVISSIDLIEAQSSCFDSFRIPDTFLIPDDTSYVAQKKSLSLLLADVFYLGDEEAQVLSEFVLADKAPAMAVADQKQVTTKSVIKGLIADSSQVSGQQRQGPKTVVKKKKQVKKQDSRRALKYRGKESIRDSIANHIPQLQALYKKHLKVHQSMSGFVYVHFEVTAGGSVSSAAIRQSQIQEKEFIDPFMAYVKRIRFQPIPESVGSMSFDFPFEFSPES
ncbi:MAG: TonB family protein [Fibrobacterota bacterium]